MLRTRFGHRRQDRILPLVPERRPGRFGPCRRCRRSRCSPHNQDQDRCRLSPSTTLPVRAERPVIDGTPADVGKVSSPIPMASTRPRTTSPALQPSKASPDGTGRHQTARRDPLTWTWQHQITGQHPPTRPSASLKPVCGRELAGAFDCRAAPHQRLGVPPWGSSERAAGRPHLHQRGR